MRTASHASSVSTREVLSPTRNERAWRVTRPAQNLESAADGSSAVLTLIGRDVAGVRELSRILAREGFLWCEPTQVSWAGDPSSSQQALPLEIFDISR